MIIIQFNFFFHCTLLSQLIRLNVQIYLNLLNFYFKFEGTHSKIRYFLFIFIEKAYFSTILRIVTYAILFFSSIFFSYFQYYRFLFQVLNNHCNEYLNLDKKNSIREIFQNIQYNNNPFIPIESENPQLKKKKSILIPRLLEQFYTYEKTFYANVIGLLYTYIF